MSPALGSIVIQVTTLTNGDLLQNADGGPQGVGAMLTVPRTGDYLDGLLSAGESVDVPFAVCLTDTTPFQFFVDVLAVVNSP